MRWLVVVTLTLAACDKGPGVPPPDEHPPMAPSEQERGAKLCQTYVDRVCACAKKDASLADICELSKGQPSAVRMHLDVLRGAPLAPIGANGELGGRDGATTGKRPPLNESERRLTESSLRKVIAACVELDAKLDPLKCPRTTGVAPP
jgi:DNA-binding transcriptional ArsR family regulator